LANTVVALRTARLGDPIDARAAFIGEAITITIIPRLARIGSLRALGAFARAPIRRSVVLRRDARAGASAAKATAIEPWMLVTDLDGPCYAHADVIANIVGPSVAIVVDVRGAVAGTWSAGRLETSVGGRIGRVAHDAS
jgi:hypothetical protein